MTTRPRPSQTILPPCPGPVSAQAEALQILHRRRRLSGRRLAERYHIPRERVAALLDEGRPVPVSAERLDADGDA